MRTDCIAISGGAWCQWCAMLDVYVVARLTAGWPVHIFGDDNLPPVPYVATEACICVESTTSSIAVTYAGANSAARWRFKHLGFNGGLCDAVSSTKFLRTSPERSIHNFSTPAVGCASFHTSSFLLVLSRTFAFRQTSLRPLTL